jgi:hypothetical protein
LTAQPLRHEAPSRLAIYRHGECPGCRGERGAFAAVDSITRGAGCEVWAPCEFCRDFTTWELRTVFHDGGWFALACPEIDGSPALAGAVLGRAVSEDDARSWMLIEEWPLDRFDVRDRRVIAAMELSL